MEDANTILAELQNEMLSDERFTSLAVQTMKASTNEVLQRAKNSIRVAVNENAEPVVGQVTSLISNSLGSIGNAWIESNAQQLMVVPEGTKFVHRDNDRLLIIVEQKPTVRRVRWYNQAYNISLPYIQFYIKFIKRDGGDRFESLSVSATKTPIERLSDKFCHAPISNINHTNVCTGDMARNAVSLNVCENVSAIVAGYWASSFNTDLHMNLSQFFRANFAEEYKSQPKDRDTENFTRCYQKWQAISAENPMWAVSPECILHTENHSSFAVSSQLPNDIASRNGRAALSNNLKTVIDRGIDQVVGAVTVGLRNVDISEENRDQPHKAVLKATLATAMKNNWDRMWLRIHARHEAKVIQDNRDLEKRKREFEYQVQNSQAIIDRVNTTKQNFDEETKRVTCELFSVYKYLESELQKVAELKSKLSQWVDDEGNPLPTRRRGRPKIERTPDEVLIRMNDVRSSTHLVSHLGEPEKKKRGRPRKNPVNQAV